MAKTIVVSVNSSWNLLNFRVDLLRRLIAEGYIVVALTPDDDQADKLRDLGIEHVSVSIDSQGISLTRDARLLIRYWSVLRQIRPDAYLGWTIKPNTYGALAAHALGIPVINNISGLGTAFISQGWLTRIASGLYRLALFRSATVFFQNAADRDFFIEKRLVDRARTALLPGSGIDTTRFKSVGGGEESVTGTAPFTFLMIARLIRDKGAFEYVEAAAKIGASRSGVRFEILGPIDVANRTAITRRQLEQWMAAGVINYLGQVDDVRPFIAKADCVVLPSYREGMPRSLLEAAAMGKPLIATDVPGCTEIARKGDNALLCKVRDANSLARAMNAMLDLPREDREAMGRHSRRIAETEFNVSVVEERYLTALAAAFA